MEIRANMRHAKLAAIIGITVSGAGIASLLYVAEADSLKSVSFVATQPSEASSYLPVPAGSPTAAAVPKPLLTVAPKVDDSRIVNFEPEIDALPNILSSDDIHLPLDEYRLSFEKVKTRNIAWARLEQKCMGRFELEGIVGSKMGRPRASTLVQFLAIKEARESGYKTLSSPSDQESLTRSRPISKEEEIAATPVFLGTTASYQGKPVPSGGCRKEASDMINAGVGSLEIDPSDLAFASGSSAAKDSRVVKATALWSACMKEAGLSYASPQDAATDPAWNAEEKNSSEKDTAFADAQCRQKSNLLNTQVAVESAYQKVLISKNKEALDRTKAQLQKQIENAAKLI